jgi:hypothetical protein
MAGKYTLRCGASLPVEEYNQTQNNLTEATEALYSVLTTKGIRLYNAPDLRELVLNRYQWKRLAGFGSVNRKPAVRLTGPWL